jgi:cobaltochelatase CobT
VSQSDQEHAQLRSVTAACLRTLAEDPTLQTSLDSVDAASLRGEADARASRLRFAVPEDGTRLRPGGRAGEAFDELLTARAEAMGARWLAGIAANLAERLRRAGGSRLHDLAYRTFVQSGTSPVTLTDALGSLTPLLQDPLRCAARAAQVAPRLVDWLDVESAPAGVPRTEASASAARDAATPQPGADRMDGDEGVDGAPKPGAQHEQSFASAAPLPPALCDGYGVFTRRFDEIVDASVLGTSAELDLLRTRLDAELAPYRHWIARLARRLQRHIQARQCRFWSLDEEEGQLDPSRLTRVITDATFVNAFRREREGPFRETVVTLLVDNSGSMRGKPIGIAAVTTDILARTLERCGVKVEVLGFTTIDANGGRPREQWMRSGSPANPGRLNALRHVIYKSADTPWNRARRHLGLLLKESLLKENVDGEAVWWAHQRLAARREARRILIVVSDGAPHDDSTLRSNHPGYLERHLRLVIEWIEQHSPVELLAIGIGHDVHRFYRRATMIRDADHLGEALIQCLRELFA